MVFDLGEKGWKRKHLLKNTELALAPACSNLNDGNDGTSPLLPSSDKTSILYPPLNRLMKMNQVRTSVTFFFLQPSKRLAWHRDRNRAYTCCAAAPPQLIHFHAALTCTDTLHDAVPDTHNANCASWPATRKTQLIVAELPLALALLLLLHH